MKIINIQDIPKTRQVLVEFEYEGKIYFLPGPTEGESMMPDIMDRNPNIYKPDPKAPHVQYMSHLAAARTVAEFITKRLMEKVDAMGKLKTEARWQGPVALFNMGKECLVKGCKRKMPKESKIAVAGEEATYLGIGRRFVPTDGTMEQTLSFNFEIKTTKFLCLIHKAFWKLSN